MSGKVRQLAALHGIAAEYRDIWDNVHRVGDETLRALLAAMGIDASTDKAVDEALIRTNAARWGRVIDAAIVVREGAAAHIELRLPAKTADATLAWKIVAEDGREWRASFDARALRKSNAVTIARRRCVARELPLDVSLPCGYHTLSILDGDRAIGDASLIVSPLRCHLPPAFADGGRAWGVAAQLYGLRSQRNWGSGDFSDLRALAACCADAGASVVGVNPLHARTLSGFTQASPYAASTRLFIDPRYIDVEAVADFNECDEAHALVGTHAFQAKLRALRDSDLVDHAGASALRVRVLEMLYANFRAHHLDLGGARADAFRRFCAEGGDALHRYAVFEALHEHFARIDSRSCGWRTWPQPYRDPASPVVAQFASDHAERVQFFAYLQWQADIQLEAACRRSTMAIGLYRDLAVSVDASGAEAWSYQHCYAEGASVGAPPDEFNMRGQDWGIAPWIPSRLVDARYAPLIAILRANMRHAGALRIDHVMSLMRLFWIPFGAPPTEGAYVSYGLDALLGIVALESRRNRCIIIGEDLGTVPDEVHSALRDAGVLSYDVFYFERRSSDDFKSPSEYDRQAIAVASTHDLPTLAGWWEGRDIAVRDALGLYPSEEERGRRMRARAEDRMRLLRALDQAGIKPPGVDIESASAPAMTPALARAIHVYLAKTPAALVVAQLEDIAGMLDQVNLPGTTTEHPNWRRKLFLTLEALPSDARFVDLARALRRERPLHRVN